MGSNTVFPLTCLSKLDLTAVAPSTFHKRLRRDRRSEGKLFRVERWTLRQERAAAGREQGILREKFGEVRGQQLASSQPVAMPSWRQPSVAARGHRPSAWARFVASAGLLLSLRRIPSPLALEVLESVVDRDGDVLVVEDILEGFGSVPVSVVFSPTSSHMFMGFKAGEVRIYPDGGETEAAAVFDSCVLMEEDVRELVFFDRGRRIDRTHLICVTDLKISHVLIHFNWLTEYLVSVDDRESFPKWLRFYKCSIDVD